MGVLKEDIQRADVTEEDDIEADDLLWHPINGAAERRRNLPT